MKHVETRCPLDPDAKDALSPGDLDEMFERIITEPYYQQFEPKVLSRPEYAPGDSAETADYKIGIWMIQFEKAATEEEADRLIELGGFLGYERSSDVGEELEDGTHDKYVNTGRTSTNAWCVNECYNDPLAQSVMQRIENITGIPETNSENLQLLRYDESQFYQTHNDYIPYQRERPCGVRILTFYIYLNDVEEGGGTNFPRAVEGGITAVPKKGRAVLWPSVFNNHPNTKDSRSDHQALPVLKGVKYGANAWIHQRDFKSANRVGCA
jgi:prolyl 4-hydroxylase